LPTSRVSGVQLVPEKACSAPTAPFSSSKPYTAGPSSAQRQNPPRAPPRPRATSIDAHRVILNQQFGTLRERKVKFSCPLVHKAVWPAAACAAVTTPGNLPLEHTGTPGSGTPVYPPLRQRRERRGGSRARGLALVYSRFIPERAASTHNPRQDPGSALWQVGATEGRLPRPPVDDATAGDPEASPPVIVANLPAVGAPRRAEIARSSSD
jgi:hypothetical protein